MLVSRFLSEWSFIDNLQENLNDMKKWMLLAVLVAGLITGAIYYFIPAQLHIASSGYVGCNARPAALLLLESEQWKRWWPHQTGNDTVFQQNGFSFSVSNKSPYAADMLIKDTDGQMIVSVANLILYKNDTTGIEWQCTLHNSANPITRFQNYLLATRIKKSMDQLLKSFILFANDEQHVYGVKIERERFKDTFMISSQTHFSAYPSEKNIYEHIEKLTQYAASKGASPINPPMLNIESVDSSGYLLKLALPISKEIPSSDSFRFRFMIQGNTLRANVTGGPQHIKNTIEQMRLYIGDFHLSSPAIPFESLITNRSLEKDSSKWTTNIFYPVM